MAKPNVILEIPFEEAERLRDGLSDILCIVRGIGIAKPKLARQFMGIEQAQDLNLKLKSAIQKVSQ